MLSLPGFTPIWGFSMIVYKTFDKDFKQIGANLPPELLKKRQFKHWKQKGGPLEEENIFFKKCIRFGQV